MNDVPVHVCLCQAHDRSYSRYPLSLIIRSKQQIAHGEVLYKVIIHYHMYLMLILDFNYYSGTKLNF